MSGQNEFAERTALSLIAADVRFFRDLALHPRCESIRPFAFLALMPFLSAFVFESADYTARNGLVSSANLRSHEHLLRTSRQRLKLLDDDRKSFEAILQSASNLAAINSRWFYDRHRGMLGPLNRLLQRDLGICVMEGEPVFTTHVLFLNMGLTEESLTFSSLSLKNLGPFLQSTSEDFGRYMRMLLDALGLDAQKPDDALDAPKTEREFRDFKSERFYDAIARQVAPGRIPICILLTSILSQVNTARVIVPMVAGNNNIAAFKVGFVSLFHAASSLQKLLNHDRLDHFLNADAAQRISTIVGHRSVKNVRKNRALRNTLVHYRVESGVSARLSSEPPLFSLVEACSAGKRTFSSVANDVTVGLDHVSVGLRELIPPSVIASGTIWTPGSRGGL